MVGSGKAVRKVKKKRYTVDDEGNMVTETYFEEEEIPEAELAAQKEAEKPAKSDSKDTAPKPKKTAPPPPKGPMKQKSIASFFTKKK